VADKATDSGRKGVFSRRSGNIPSRLPLASLITVYRALSDEFAAQCSFVFTVPFICKLEKPSLEVAPTTPRLLLLTYSQFPIQVCFSSVLPE